MATTRLGLLGQIDVREAQKAITEDWIDLFKKIFPGSPLGGEAAAIRAEKGERMMATSRELTTTASRDPAVYAPALSLALESQ